MAKVIFVLFATILQIKNGNFLKEVLNKNDKIPRPTTRIKAVLDKGWYLEGEENQTFARNFAKFCGTKFALGVANGLDGLNLIIKAALVK